MRGRVRIHNGMLTWPSWQRLVLPLIPMRSLVLFPTHSTDSKEIWCVHPIYFQAFLKESLIPIFFLRDLSKMNMWYKSSRFGKHSIWSVKLHDCRMRTWVALYCNHPNIPYLVKIRCSVGRGTEVAVLVNCSQILLQRGRGLFFPVPKSTDRGEKKSRLGSSLVCLHWTRKRFHIDPDKTRGRNIWPGTKRNTKSGEVFALICFDNCLSWSGIHTEVQLRGLAGSQYNIST